MLDEKNNNAKVRIGIIGHQDYDKETLLEVFRQKTEELLDYQRKREPFVRDRNHENISIVGKGSSQEVRPTTLAALQYLEATREKLTGIKQELYGEDLSIIGTYDESESKKHHK